MTEQRGQQNVEGRTTTDEGVMRCLAPNCGKELKKTYNGLEVCNKDCWNRYLTRRATKKQMEDYTVPPHVRIKLFQHDMGRSYGSLEQFAQQAQLTL